MEKEIFQRIFSRTSISVENKFALEDTEHTIHTRVDSEMQPLKYP